MLFQTCKISVHISYTNEDFFSWNLMDFCPSIDSYATTTLMPQKFILVKIFTLYHQQIEFKLLFTYKHSETMRFILVLRSTFELLQKPMRFILMLQSTFELLQVSMNESRYDMRVSNDRIFMFEWTIPLYSS